MQGSLAISLVRAALDRFERARATREPKFTVSLVARAWGRGRGRGAAHGRRVHERLWGDLSLISQSEAVATPLPLAWRFRFGWVYGVADQVLFERGVPVRVAEVKSYDSYGLSEPVQASLYGLLLELNFGVRPIVELVGRRATEICGWEELALEALSLFARKLSDKNIFSNI